MENQVFRIGSGATLLLKDEIIWMLNKKISTPENFTKELNKTGIMKADSSKIALNSIQKVLVNNASESTKVEYVNDKGKVKTESLEFNDKKISDDFGHYLGTKLSFAKSHEVENKTKPLLLNLLFVVISAGITVLFATMDDTSEITSSGSRRNGGAKAIIKLVVDTLGQTGTWIVGSLITLFLIYRLYKRYSNPGEVTVYSK